jgi:hypothetical protein
LLATSASGFVECFGQDIARGIIFANLNRLQGPQKRTFHYHKLPPNIGFSLRFQRPVQRLRQLLEGLSVPSTDNPTTLLLPEGHRAGEAGSGDHGQL